MFLGFPQWLPNHFLYEGMQPYNPGSLDTSHTWSLKSFWRTLTPCEKGRTGAVKLLPSLKQTYPLKTGRAPNGNNRIPSIHFRCELLVSGMVLRTNLFFSVDFYSFRQDLGFGGCLILLRFKLKKYWNNQRGPAIFCRFLLELSRKVASEAHNQNTRLACQNDSKARHYQWTKASAQNPVASCWICSSIF